MSHVERNHTIAFLLSLGALPLGCVAGDSGDSDTNNSSSVSASTNPSTADGTAGSDGSTGGTSASTSPTGSSTLTTTSPTDPTDPTDPSGVTTYSTSGYTSGYTSYGSGGTGGALCPVQVETPEVCAQFAAKQTECYPRYSKYEDYVAGACACDLGHYSPMYGDGCVSASQDYYACIAALSCEELMAPGACEAEFMALEGACAG